MSTTDQMIKLENRIFELEQENKRLHDTVEYLTRKLFGKSSEKTSTLNLGQMSIFDEVEIEADPKAPEPDLKEVDPKSGPSTTTVRPSSVVNAVKTENPIWKNLQCHIQ
jgi:hypothetical protein